MYAKELMKRKQILERVIEKINREMPDFPEGNLRICTGKNLILTFETDYAPLDIRNLRSNIKEIFLPK